MKTTSQKNTKSTSLRGVQKWVCILIVPAMALVFTGCKVEKTAEGEMPEVDVQTKEGNLPEYDIVKTEEGNMPEVDVDVKGGKLPRYEVETADVNVEKEKVRVEVPDVDIGTEEKTITVPTIDVDMPGKADQYATEADQRLIVLVRTNLGQQDEANAALLQSWKISANNGVVTLEGKVPTAEQKSQIEARVKQVPGVTQVKNQLEIEN